MKNSFAVFLNIILGLLLIGSIVFSYFFGNFGGISLKELNDGYLLKKELSFSDLPKEVQKRYINKEKFNSAKKEDKIERVFDDEGNPLIEDIDSFRDVITSLQERVSFLEKENVILSTDKDELLKIVAYEKAKNSTTNKALLSNNLEKINEAEKQHYQNISELTQKINDLHRENIKLSQKLNNKDEESKNAIDALKLKIEEEKKSLKDREDELEKVYNLKVSAIMNTNKTQKEKIKDLEERLSANNSSIILELGKKDQQITLLQNKINKMMLEKNTLLTKNSQMIMELERKNSKKLQEFNDIVKNSSHEKDAIKEEYKKTIKRVENKYANLINAKEKEIETLSQKLAYEKQNSITVLENSEKMILEKEKLANKKVQDLNSESQSKIEMLTKKVADLESNLMAQKTKEKQILAQLDTKKIDIALDADRILQLEDKIKVLELSQRSIDKEVDEQVKLNEEKHNKNYKILNEKIATLEMNVRSKQKENAEVLLMLSKEKTKLSKKLNGLVDDNRKKELTIKNLKINIEKIEKKKNSLELSENEKLVAIRKSFDDLKASIDLREKEYKQQIEHLKSSIASKDDELKQREKDKEKLGKYIREITSLKKTLKEIESGKKLVKVGSKLELLGKVECGDMVSGNFKISSTCKAKVEKFLSKYNETNYFEVIPIIGTGGFASLSKVQRDGTLGIPDSEIERLTRLSNIGLGRDRAKEGGWLIRDKFGDNVKISYTVYSIEAKDKRGFVIRAYR